MSYKDRHLTHETRDLGEIRREPGDIFSVTEERMPSIEICKHHIETYFWEMKAEVAGYVGASTPQTLADVGEEG
jgi:hypothetical protein